MAESKVIFKFPPTSCEQSMDCTGCHQRSDWAFDETFFPKSLENVVVNNQDVITYQKSLNPLPQVYCEVFSNYEDSLINGDVLPAAHGISVEQFRTLKEVEKAVLCSECGGCGFIVYKTTGWICTPICVNGWKGYPQNGWLNEN
jgi:hypothetical protein